LFHVSSSHALTPTGVKNIFFNLKLDHTLSVSQL
jgi:hypothetical protein